MFLVRLTGAMLVLISALVLGLRWSIPDMEAECIRVCGDVGVDSYRRGEMCTCHPRCVP